MSLHLDPSSKTDPKTGFSSFSFNDTATTEIYTLSLHDALPICRQRQQADPDEGFVRHEITDVPPARADRKSTRLNSSHDQNSYAVFCLKNKKHDRSRAVLEEKKQINPKKEKRKMKN